MLTAQGISKRFNRHWALKGVSFSAREGEVLGLIGPNGAGKTTLLECLAGLLPASEGTVKICDRVTPPTHRKKDLFYMPDGILPWPNQTVRLKPNGDYLAVRFNGKEDNVVLWTFNKGKRSFVKKGSENVPLAMNQWNSLRIAVHGTTLQGYLNDRLLLEYTLAEPVSGRVGMWSKTDSVSYFDDFTVTPAAK